MRDADLRTALLRGVAKQMGGRRHLLVPEVEIRWSIPARIDALMVADRITGFELKSAADSLGRLPRQIEAYSAVVERATLVLAQRHLEAGMKLAPAWWSIWVARENSDGATMRRVRGGNLNPGINPLAVLSFMTRDALVAALRELGHQDLSRLSIDELRATLYNAVPRARLMRIAREAMLLRGDWHGRALLRAPGPFAQMEEHENSELREATVTGFPAVARQGDR